MAENSRSKHHQNTLVMEAWIVPSPLFLLFSSIVERGKNKREKLDAIENGRSQWVKLVGGYAYLAFPPQLPRASRSSFLARSSEWKNRQTMNSLRNAPCLRRYLVL